MSELASIRYLHYQHHLKAKLRALLDLSPARFEANIKVDDLEPETGRIEAVTKYTFAQLKSLASSHGSQLLLVMDGNRELIYTRGSVESNAVDGALALNRLAARIAQQLDISFLDLHPIFARDFADHGQKFNFALDGHWDAYAHQVVANAIAKRIAGVRR